MEGVPKRARKDVKQLVYELMQYPKPFRQRVLMDMDIIDIIMVAQAEKALSQWMRENNIWRGLWVSKVVPMMIAHGYARDEEHALDMSLGDNQRQNCIVWYFMCNRESPHFDWDLIRMKSRTSGFDATILRNVYTGIVTWMIFRISVGEGDLKTLKNLLPGSAIDTSSGDVVWQVENEIDIEPMRARIFYALLSMGYHFIVAMRDDSKRTFYIRSGIKD